MKIVTKYEFPPIPDRSMDFSAIDSDTYDGPGSKIGRGATEQEAVQDLLEQLQGEAWSAVVIFDVNDLTTTPAPSTKQRMRIVDAEPIA